MTFRNIYTTLILLALSKISFAQKPVPDYNTLNKSAKLGDGLITSNGKFFIYLIEQNGRQTIYIRTPNKSPDISIANAANPVLIGNENYLLFTKGNDTLGILQLGGKNISYKRISKGPVTPSDKTKKTIAWWTASSDLVLLNTITQKTITYPSVENVIFSSDGKKAIITEHQDKRYTLKWMDVTSSHTDIIWQGTSLPSDISFNYSNTKIAFFIDDSTHPTIATNICVIDEHGIPLYIKSPSNDITRGSLNFSKNDNRLFFWCKSLSQQPLQSSTESIQVDVWHYKDKLLQSQQLQEKDNVVENTLSVYNFANQNIIKLNLEENERYFSENGSLNFDCDYLFVTKSINEIQETQYAPFTGKTSLIAISLENGKRTTIIDRKFITRIALSPSGNYLVFYDQIKKEYFSCDLKNKSSIPITSNFPTSLSNDFLDEEQSGLSYPAGFAITGWTSDNSVIISDKYDLWKIDLKAAEAPVNLTNGYGRKHSIQLSPLIVKGFNENDLFISQKKQLLLKGIDSNYSNGFYRLPPGRNKDVIKLSAEACNFYIKEKSGNEFLLQKSNSNNSPNWYTSTDLISFNQLTNIQPQAPYNWYTTELIRWKMFNGKWSQGVLYKPENFDSTKTYPIIFHFYEIMSTNLHSYNIPLLSDGDLDPAWFATRGYLVFEPDIYFKFGAPGPSAYNAVASAAEFLSQNKWVDKNNMALCGISMGAYEVNYIITCTNKFKAAVAASGQVDLISGYSGLREAGVSRQYIYETGQTRMGTTPWENTDLYIKNSPIFHAEKVNTPLLIMHNKEDNFVPWSQGLEWFTALRRLGKKSWMLQYDGEGHSLSEEKNKLDFTKRLEQFLGHYLKNMPQPAWMEEGIPAKLKGIKTGLEPVK